MLRISNWPGVCAAIFLGSLGVGCGGRPPPHPEAALPGYDGAQAAVFSDLFRPELFGLEPPDRPEEEGLLPDRAQRADSVVPVRVVTVTRETRGLEQNYTVVVQPSGDPVVGQSVPAPLALLIPARSPAFGWLDLAGEKWVGTRLLLFLKKYTGGVHFFGSVDTPAVRTAVVEQRRLATLPPSNRRSQADQSN